MIKKYIDVARELKKNCSTLRRRVVLIIFGRRESLEKLEIRGRIYMIHIILLMGKNTEKIPGDLGRFAFSQTQGKAHHLRLVQIFARSIVLKKERERSCRIVNFAFPANHRLKLK